MAKWDFKIVGASFVKELVPVNGDVEFRSQSFMQPGFDLEGDKIVMKESGAYKTAIIFSQIGTIDGIEPTDIEDAYAKLLILVENFNQGGGTPGTTPSLQQVATKGAVTTIPLKVTNVKIGDYDENGKAFSISDNNDAVSNLYYTPLVGFVADDGAGSTAGLTPYEFNVGDVSENSILIKTGLEINQSGVANTSFSIDKLTTDNGEYLYPTGVSSPLATLNDITGGVTPTLQQVLIEDNQTNGENILVNNADAIELENGSKLSEGLYDEGTGGNKGIARTCAVGYEDKWEAGEQYITEIGSGIIQFRRFAFNVPTVNDDTTKRYAIGSYWQMRNNDIYICTDPTDGAAVWEIYSVAGIPTLTEVLAQTENTVVDTAILFQNTANDFETSINEFGDGGIILRSTVNDTATTIGSGVVFIGDADLATGTYITKEQITVNSIPYLLPTGTSSPLATLADITSGGIESVTGTTVDNTDPLNPIVNVPDFGQVLQQEDRVVKDLGDNTPYTFVQNDAFEYIFNTASPELILNDSDNSFKPYSEIIVKNTFPCALNFDAGTTVFLTGVAFINTLELVPGDNFTLKKINNTPLWIMEINRFNIGSSSTDLGTSAGLPIYSFAFPDTYKVNFFNSQVLGDGSVFLDNISFPPNSTIIFQNELNSIPAENISLYDFEFTTDALVYYKGQAETSITINPGDYCVLRQVGFDSLTSKYVWSISITNKSIGGGGGVPYTGATQDLDLGEFGLLTGNIEFDNTPTNIPTTAGSMVWNDTDGTVDLKLKGGNVTLQIGQENVLRVVNKTATNINLLEANYQAVRVTGAQGQRLKVDLAQATTDALSAETIGLVTETINNNQEGFITTGGLIRNVNTTGSLQSETWADGDILYLSPTVAGRITKVKPTAPNHLVIIGYVVHAHATQGSIFVKIDNGYELNELHNVKITSETNNQLLVYTSATDIWENKSLIDILKTFNKTQGIYFFEEFMGIQGGSVLTSFGGLVTTTSGTGANCITTNASFPIVNRTNQQGVVRAQTGTTLSGFAGSSYGSVNLFRGNGTVSVETYVTVETLSTATERFHTIFGHVGIANFNNPANGIFFAYDEGGAIGFLGAGSPNWRCYAINTTRTIFTSSVAVVAGTWYKLRIDLNAAGTQAEFYINDNLITTLTTNMPATTTPMSVQNVIVKTIGTTTRAMQTDYFMYEEIFTNPR